MRVTPINLLSLNFTAWNSFSVVARNFGNYSFMNSEEVGGLIYFIKNMHEIQDAHILLAYIPLWYNLVRAEALYIRLALDQAYRTANTTIFIVMKAAILPKVMGQHSLTHKPSHTLLGIWGILL